MLRRGRSVFFVGIRNSCARQLAEHTKVGQSSSQIIGVDYDVSRPLASLFATGMMLIELLPS
jgi:hypothetical protein